MYKRIKCGECDRLSFEANYEPEPNSGCWIWIASRHGPTSKAPGQYGKFAGAYAHRWAYRFFIGPIAEGLQINHKCRNKSCVNPHHLEAITLKENLRHANWREFCVRGHKKGVGNRCRRCHAEDERRRRPAA